jgi:hypothetical protein
MARHESAVSARTVALWAAPTLWALVLVAQMRNADLQTALGNAAGVPFFAGLLAAALAVSLPGRTRGARAQDILDSLPASGAVAPGRVLAALWAATALVAIAPAAGVLYALLGGVSLAGSAGALGIYLAVVLPAAWVGAMLGGLAGTVVRDIRLAALVLFLGGVGAAFVARLHLVLTPLGAWDILGNASGAPAVPWPLRPLLPWHVLAMTSTAVLLGAAVAGLLRRRALGTAVLALGGVAGVVAGVAGYTATLSGFAVPVGFSGQATGAASPWQVQRMAVTLRVGRPSVATDSMVLSNAGTGPVASVALHLPVGLAATAARITGGQTLVPGPVLHLPSAVPPGGSVRLTVTYGGRWTAFHYRWDNTLARAAGPGHLVLTPNAGGRYGWLPAPSPFQIPSFPLTLRLTGDTPSPTFCNLPAVAPDTWQGTVNPQGSLGFTCLGDAGLHLARAGSVELWSSNDGASLTGAARMLNREVAAVASCLGVPDVPLGAVFAPVTSEGWSAGFTLSRYGDRTQIAVVQGPAQPQSPLSPFGFLAWSDATSFLWGQAPAPSRQAAPGVSLGFELRQLVPAVAARRAGLPPSAVFGPTPSNLSPGAAAVATALGRLSPQGGCALLASLRQLDAQGELTDAAATAAITHAEGAPA